ncbi:MAG: ATP-dependent helicase Lhr and Lhr-like helicase [Gammaproteobacteria bacterium]|jgi:ATP-dependent Lhr-like helicase|nr:ATP-dependent helicase Lhr and Lhr-like helicase [Gammaproteobacteria bacterium]
MYVMHILESFHPAVAAWFARTHPAPTEAQAQAWPAIQAGRDVLVAAPTGSGKTLAAFLAAIDQLVKEGSSGGLPDETRVLYISPLKALSNDIHRNLEAPLEGIRAELAALGMQDVDIRTVVRTGDTSQSERARIRRKAPHIVVTTPESLYVLLGSQSGRSMLATCRTVIVDEIHAVAANKRGTHLALSLERLQAITGHRPARVGLSATQTPIEEVARFLIGANRPLRDCVIVDLGAARSRDLALELPPVPLEPVMSGEVWSQVYDRLAELVREHRTTLVFVNTRRLAERIARHLSERLGEEHVAAHHGSLARERRFKAEQQLKRGELKVLVATASLELGLDIGDVDLVCQIGSTRSINTFLQRVGRAGHAVGGTSKGRLFPLSRDELVECTALLDAVRRGELDRLVIPSNALDVLTQQIAAEVAAREWSEDALFDLFRAAHPYRDLERADFDECVNMLAEGFSTRRGRHGALLYRDSIIRSLRPRKGARLTSITSGGTIPDNADYKVMLEPEGISVGTVNEDFAVESLQGDIFQLGNTSYRILRVERGTVRVEDAHGQPPSIPFWLGEAPGRSDELSAAVARLRSEIGQRLEGSAAGASHAAASQWLIETVGIDEIAAAQLVEYLAAGRAALQELPTLDTIIFERFFDESGGMQLVIHSSYGSRVNRAWGLSLRKRFCRTFNFELQAAATEDHIVLSLTHAHSFELTQAARYLSSSTVRQVLVQALCAAPMFGVRWRWTAGIALALPRFRGGKKIPAQIARMNAEDLLASVFPDQVACAENLPGEIEIPDHPLVRQTIRDCLESAMDVDTLEEVLRRLESGRIRIIARDLTEPSPLALEALNARPYAYLDDAPLEERRTQAVMARRWIDAASAADIGRLDPEAVARVRDEAWPDAATGDELCDALSWLTFVSDDEVRKNDAWPRLIGELVAQGRVVRIEAPGHRTLWVNSDRRGLFEPQLPSSDEALVSIIRGRLEGLGPVTAAQLGEPMGLSMRSATVALTALETEGFVMRGRFTPDAAEEQWCERRLLARIHRYTVKRLRAEIEPVQARDFLRFLFDWQRALPAARLQGVDAVAAVLQQLEGFEAPSSAWEGDILPARIAEYDPHWLDEHCRAGRFVWARLQARRADQDLAAGPIRSTPITLLARRNVKVWSELTQPHDAAQLSYKPRAVLDFLTGSGASFFDDIADGVGMLPVEVEESLGELVALGFVNSDSFGGLRALLVPSSRRASPAARGRRGRRIAMFGMADAGRWAIVRRDSREPPRHPGEDAGAAHAGAAHAVEQVVRTLLRRWGVIFWKLLAREADWLPSWRDVLMCCRRLEARGEIRGGRFVAGFAGEQFATPEAIAPLREARRRPPADEYVSLSGADPLNLLGIVTPGARLPSLTGNRLLYRDGLPIATFAAGEVNFLETLDPKKQWEARNALLRRQVRLLPAAAQSLDEGDAGLEAI